MTPQEKLDKLGDRLKKNHSLLDSLPINTSKQSCPNPYDIHTKGLKYDALQKKQKATYKLLITSVGQEFVLTVKLKEEKQRNDELVEILNNLYNRIYPGSLYNEDLWQRVKKALKNNSE